MTGDTIVGTIFLIVILAFLLGLALSVVVYRSFLRLHSKNIRKSLLHPPDDDTPSQAKKDFAFHMSVVVFYFSFCVTLIVSCAYALSSNFPPTVSFLALQEHNQNLPGNIIVFFILAFSFICLFGLVSYWVGIWRANQTKKEQKGWFHAFW